jgi:hypothetical protein
VLWAARAQETAARVTTAPGLVLVNGALVAVDERGAFIVPCEIDASDIAI